MSWDRQRREYISVERESQMRETHFLKLWTGLDNETIAQVINREDFRELKGTTPTELWNVQYLNGKTATVITCAIGWDVTREMAIKFATDYVMGRTITHYVDLRDCGFADFRIKKPPVTNRGVTES